MIVWLIVVSCLCQVEGRRRNLIFKKVPSTGSLTGISCALENYDATHARGGKFDHRSGACETLSETWFSNQTFENNKTYHTLQMEESIFQAGQTIRSVMPPGFPSSGSSVELDIFMGDITSRIGLAIDITGGSILCYHLRVELPSNQIIANSKKNGLWQPQLTVPAAGIFPTSNTTYRFEIRLTTAAIEFHVDGGLVSTYPHKLPFTDCDTINVNPRHSNTFECQRIKYFY